MKAKSVMNFGVHLARTYLTALPRIAYRSTASLLVDPRGAQTFLHDVLGALDVGVDDSVLGSADVTDVLSGAGQEVGAGGEPIDIALIGRLNVVDEAETRILRELADLAFLVKVTKPRRIFEIGTFIGRTTRLFAINAGADCEVVTLDLPRSQTRHDPGVEFRGTQEAKRIVQVYGDSRSFDYSPWFGSCDFVWVDACHDHDFVVSDTRNALKLCRPGGWIGWHDYRHTAWWSGVTRCVREMKKKHSGITHLRGTTTALLRTPG